MKEFFKVFFIVLTGLSVLFGLALGFVLGCLAFGPVFGIPVTLILASAIVAALWMADN